MKVLVVEDEVLMREIVVEQLVQMGIYSICEAGSVDEAKKIVDGGEFDLIVSDYSMPGEHGGNLLRYLYEKKFTTPFVFFTSSVVLDLPVTSENFLGIVEKPNIAKLMQVICSKNLKL